MKFYSVKIPLARHDSDGSISFGSETPALIGLQIMRKLPTTAVMPHDYLTLAPKEPPLIGLPLRGLKPTVYYYL